MKLHEQIQVTAELCGTRMSDLAVAAMAKKLSKYPPMATAKALSRCSEECTRLTVRAVLERMPGGHPSAEEAWAIALGSFDESRSLVWTEQIRQASGVAGELMAAGDKVAARMAFKEKYQELVADADGPPEWSFDEGTDKPAAIEACARGVQQGKLSMEQLRFIADSVCLRMGNPVLPPSELQRLSGEPEYARKLPPPRRVDRDAPGAPPTLAALGALAGMRLDVPKKG